MSNPPTQVGQIVYMIGNPETHGTVTRMQPLLVQGACVVKWSNGKSRAYFGQDYLNLVVVD